MILVLFWKKEKKMGITARKTSVIKMILEFINRSNSFSSLEVLLRDLRLVRGH